MTFCRSTPDCLDYLYLHRAYRGISVVGRRHYFLTSKKTHKPYRLSKFKNGLFHDCNKSYLMLHVTIFFQHHVACHCIQYLSHDSLRSCQVVSNVRFIGLHFCVKFCYRLYWCIQPVIYWTFKFSHRKCIYILMLFTSVKFRSLLFIEFIE